MIVMSDKQSDAFTLTMRALMAAGAIIIALFGWSANRTLTGIDTSLQHVQKQIEDQWTAVDSVKNIAVSTDKQVNVLGAKVDDLKERTTDLGNRVQRLEGPPAPR